MQLGKKYKITGAIDSDHHMIVRVDHYLISLLGERKAVAQAAWEQLMENEKNEYGQDTGRPSNTQRILRKLCETIGSVELVAEKFKQTILYEEVGDASEER